MDDVVSTVDALVSDEPSMPTFPYGIDSPLRSGTPSFPPGFGHIQALQNPTPPPPPGFSRPMTPVTSMTPTNMNSQMLPKPPVPVIPLVDPSTVKEFQDTAQPQEEQQPKLQPAKRDASRVVSLASTVGDATTATAEGTKLSKAAETASSTAPQETPAPATPVSKLAKKASVLQDEDFPALDAAAISAVKPNNVAAQEKSSKPSTPVGKKVAEKRPAHVPAALNIAAASKPSAAKGAEASPASTEKHTAADAAAFPSLPTPAAPWSPVVRSTPAHKSIRVVQVTKADAAAGPAGLAVMAVAENAKNASASSTPTMTHAVLANRQPSALANRPSTPASEIVSLSDNASVVSASISASRAGSPPPSRIGSAAVRTTTKSQQRKQRKQVSKMGAAAVVEAATTTSTSLVGPPANDKEEEAVEIAPIMGRKKKQKKEKPAPTSAPAAAPAAEAAAPAKAQKEQKEKEAKSAKQAAAAKKKEEAKEKAAAAAAAESAKAAETTETAAENGSATNTAAAVVAAPAEKAAAPAPAAPPAPPPVPMQSAYEKELEILRAYLREAADISGSTTLSVAREHANGTANGAAHPTEAELGNSIRAVAKYMSDCGFICKNLDDISLLQPFTKLSTPRTVDRARPIKGDALLPPDVLFTKDDLNKIMAGRAVRKDVDNVRILATPNGDCLRNLTEAEENRFMALQHAVSVTMRSPLSYLHPRYEETGGFSLIAKRAVPCGLPSYYSVKSMAAPATSGQIIFDPMSKIQREEAVYWINQYVLPRLNLLPQSEAASWQSMLVDTGVPQAIGTTTLAPWIYHTPEMRYGMATTGAPSSSIPADTIVTNGHAHGVHPEDDDVLTLSDGTPLPSSYHLRNPSRYAPTVDRDGDLKNDLESSVHAMSVEDAERSLIEARREVKVFERALVQLVKMNEHLLKSDDLLASFAANGTGEGGPAPLAAAAY